MKIPSQPSVTRHKTGISAGLETMGSLDNVSYTIRKNRHAFFNDNINPKSGGLGTLKKSSYPPLACPFIPD